MATKVRAGKRKYEWRLSMVDDKGLLLGIHFHKYRKVPLEQISIIKAALSDAARKIDELNAKKSNAPSSADAKRSAGMTG
jgi:hypothetical protein